jgi:hypothetical protein
MITFFKIFKEYSAKLTNRYSPEELCWGCGLSGELQLLVTLVAWICLSLSW